MLSFGQPFPRFSSFGSNFNSIHSSPPIIAPFWDDVDIRRGGTIYYRQDITSQIAVQIQQDISVYFPDIRFFYPTLVFIATWYRVQSFYSNLLNTFQVVVASDGTRTFVKFNYGDIQWGRSTTLIGVSAGDRINFITHSSSLSSLNVLLSLKNTTLTYKIDSKFKVHLRGIHP